VEVKKCCGKDPTVWKSSDDDKNLDVEKIQCETCRRIVFGCDESDIDRWNNGEDDTE